LADSYLGKRILIGITYVDNEERPIEQVQLHGIIETADAIDGFRIGLLGNRSGQSWFLPPDPSAISPAAPGSYRLRSTGEIIENPDLITTWTVKKPVPEAE
jgi:hypothetical protein